MSRLVIRSLEQRFSQLSVANSSILSAKNFPCLQCTRFYRPRKPFWLGVAKTKKFKIPKHPEVPIDEKEELLRLTYVYRTQTKSLRQYFKEQLAAQTTAPEVIAERKRRELEQHADCVKQNNLWNAEVAKLREARLAKEAIARVQKIDQKILEYDRQQQKFMEEFDAHIRSEQEAAKSFITPENIDEAIEIALSKVVDHNFAIDIEGNIYKGRYGKPSPPSDPKSVQPKLPVEKVKESVQATS